MAARSLLICLVLTLSAATAPAGDSTNGAAPTAAEGSPEWLKMKLDAGDSAAVASLGIKLLLGKEARPEPKRGVALLSRAAAAGNALAECYMGIAFADGTGVPKNGLKAMDWFRASARDG